MVTDTPPVKSMSKIVLPRTATATMPIPITSSEQATAIRHLPMKSIFVAPISRIIRRSVIHP